jgi:ribosomal protein S27AE
MRSSGKMIGLGMIAAGAILGIAGGAWLISGMNEDKLEQSGAIFGLILLLGVVVLPLVGGGIFFVRKGAQEEQHMAKINEQRRLLDIVSTRGQVSIADLVLELKSSRDDVEKNLNELVGRGLFSGYVDWNKGMLYSVEASKLQGAQYCPNCGGKLELAGKGVVTCPYCGAQIFLS